MIKLALIVATAAAIAAPAFAAETAPVVMAPVAAKTTTTSTSTTVAVPVVAVPVVVVPKAAELKDSTKIEITGEKVEVIGKDGKKTAAPDGKHELKDGSFVTTKGGVIVK